MTVTLLDRSERVSGPLEAPFYYTEYIVRVQTGDTDRTFYVYRPYTRVRFMVFDDDRLREQIHTACWSTTVSVAFKKRLYVLRCYRSEYQRRFGGVSEEDMRAIQEICTE